MKILMALLLLVTFAASNVAVQDRRQRMRPEALRSKAADAETERILQRYVEALGDKKSIASIHSRVMRGLVEWSPLGITGKVDLFYKAPNKSLSVFEVPGRGQFIEAFDGRNGWLQTPFTGALDFNQRTLDAARRNADGGYDVKIKDVFSSLTLKGTQKLGTRDAYVIEAKPVAGQRELLYFDTQSGLLVRLDLMRHTPAAQNIPSSVVFDEFATVDGVKIPTLIHQIFPGFTVKIRIYEVKHNTRLEDQLFDRPSGARDSRAILEPE